MRTFFQTKKSTTVAAVATAAFFIASTSGIAQTGRVFNKTDIFPEGRLEISTIALATKYVGEFTDNSIGEAIGLSTRYTLPFLPQISLGARYTHGYLRYDRRYKQRFGASFTDQFPIEDFPGVQNASTPRQTKIDSYDLMAYVNLFPHQSLNYYLFAGGGVLAFQPQDIMENPVKADGHKRNYTNFTEDMQYNPHAVGGLGIDYYITPSLALGAQMSFHMLTTDYVDGFAGKVATGDSYQESVMDGYGDFGVKLSYNLFTDNDADNDGLMNEDEGLLGTNAYSADSDEDGVTDFEEVKTFSSNPLIQDTDSDGLSDSEEAYKFNSNLLIADTDEDGLSDFDEARLYKTNPILSDSDGDNLTDTEEFQKGANPMIGDTDGDGIVDIADACPSVFGSRERRGCPETQNMADLALPDDKGSSSLNNNGDLYGGNGGGRDTVYIFREVKSIQENESYTPYGINFETAKAVIREESEPILDNIAKWLKTSSSVNVEIRGHTDAEGSEEFNMRLAEARAHAVRNYLIEQNIEAGRLQAIGLGEVQPVASNDDAKGRARNRRIEFIVKQSDNQQALGQK